MELAQQVLRAPEPLERSSRLRPVRQQLQQIPQLLDAHPDLVRAVGEIDAGGSFDRLPEIRGLFCKVLLEHPTASVTLKSEARTREPKPAERLEGQPLDGLDQAPARLLLTRRQGLPERGQRTSRNRQPDFEIRQSFKRDIEVSSSAKRSAQIADRVQRLTPVFLRLKCPGQRRSGANAPGRDASVMNGVGIPVTYGGKHTQQYSEILINSPIDLCHRWPSSEMLDESNAIPALNSPGPLRASRETDVLDERNQERSRRTLGGRNHCNWPMPFGGNTSKSIRQTAPFLNASGSRAPINRAASSPIFGS